MPIDVTKRRADFPILRRQVHGRPLVYLDNAATTQKPQVVIDALVQFYAQSNANVHRGMHLLSEEATAQFERARGLVARLLNASADEIVFTRNTTEAINLVAHSFLAPMLREGDEILVSELEHHSNLVPWHIVAKRHGARVVHAPLARTEATFELSASAFAQNISARTKLVAVTHTSNALGVRAPLDPIAKLCREHRVPLLVDGAQAAGHTHVDVAAMGCDFFACSGHKMLGPTGAGVLFARREHLEHMPAFLGGGEMIARVTKDGFTSRAAPHGFEAGTPAIAEAIALGRAVEYLLEVGVDQIAEHAATLGSHALARLREMPRVQVLGDLASARSGIVSFHVAGVHPHDLATMLDLDGIAVRAGEHCCQPLMDTLQVDGTVRISTYLYNTIDEIDAAADAVFRATEALAS